MAISNKTRAKINLHKGSLPDDSLASALGVIGSTMIVEDKVQLSKAEQELLQSRALTVEDDPWNQLPNERRVNLIRHTYDPVTLIGLCLQNNTLGQCIDAMEVNVDGSGYDIERLDKQPVEDKENDTTIKPIKQFFDTAFIHESFTSIRRKMRRDAESTGNAYLEVIRNQAGDITLVNHLDAKLVRMVKLDDPVQVEHEIERGGTTQKVQMLVRERRYAQLIGNKVRYFREFGSSRDINSETGEWLGQAKKPAKPQFQATNDQDKGVPVDGQKPGQPVQPAAPKPGEPVQPAAPQEGSPVADLEQQRKRRFKQFKAEKDSSPTQPTPKFGTGPTPQDDPTKRPDHESQDGTVQIPGTEVIHVRVKPDVSTPYGIPRWINQIPSVLGSRKAEELNLEYFAHGGMPPVMIFLQGGQLSPTAKADLNKYLSGEAKTKMRAVVADVYSTGGDLTTNSQVKVSVERFGGDRMNDSMFEGYDERCAGRVRSAFRLPPLFTGNTEDYNFACYDEQTETLTDQGWRKWSEYRPGMKVACVDRRTGRMSYETPAALSVYDVQDVPMHHFTGRGLDLMITPKHNMLWKEHGSWRLAPIEQMEAKRRVLFRSSVVWAEGQRLEHFEFPVPQHVQVRNTMAVTSLRWEADVFLSLLGWYVSEGHTPAQQTSIVVTQKKPHRLDEIRALVARTGVAWHDQVSATGTHNFHVKDADVAEWFAALGRESHEKALPPWVLNLPFDQLQSLFNALMAGDGTVDSRPDRKTCAYATTSPVLADQVQEIALKLGYRAKIGVNRPGTYAGPDGHPVYRVMMCEADTMDVSLPQNRQRVSYTGKVHCFTVPTGVYVTRRNGCVSVQGNTAYASYVVAEAQVFKPEREAFDEVVNNTLMAEIAPDFVYRSLPLTVHDVAVQLQAMTLAKDVVDRESFVDEVNEIAGLNLNFQDPMTDPMSPANPDSPLNPLNDPRKALMPGQDNPFDKGGGKPNPFDKKVAGGIPQPVKGGPTVASTKPKKPMPAGFAKTEEGLVLKDDQFLNLAEDWAAHLSGDREFGAANVNFMQSVIAGLHPQNRKLFNAYVGMKLAPGAKYDPDGISDLISCAGDCLSE